VRYVGHVVGLPDEIQQEIGKLDSLILQEQRMLAAEGFRLLGSISQQINILVESEQRRDAPHRL
jgi:hypothetical protein